MSHFALRDDSKPFLSHFWVFLGFHYRACFKYDTVKAISLQGFMGF